MKIPFMIIDKKRMIILLENNTEKIIDLVNSFDNLTSIDKVRLEINLLENLGFNTEYDI